MSRFQAAVSALCAALIVIGALCLLIPGGTMGKSVKKVLSLVFLLSVLSACLPAFRGLSVQIVPRPQTETDHVALHETNAEFVIKEVLQKAGVSFSKITVRTDKSDDGGISISKVIIVTDCKEETVKAALDGFAEQTEVVVTHE